MLLHEESPQKSPQSQKKRSFVLRRASDWHLVAFSPLQALPSDRNASVQPHNKARVAGSRYPAFDPSSTPLKRKRLLRKDLSVRHERSDTLFHVFDPSLGRSVGGIAAPQAWKTLPTVPRVSVRTT